MNCECGCYVRRDGLSRHKKCKKHINLKHYLALLF